MEPNINIAKIVSVFIGARIGWLVGEFMPTFPLIIVAVVFMLYDSWTAYKLDKRVHMKYPDLTGEKEAKFTSYAFGKVLRKTMPNRLWLIILVWIAQHWVFSAMTTYPLVYLITGAICFEQFVSILENEASCREESDGIIFKVMKKVLIDKTERHLDISLEEYKELLKNGGQRHESTTDSNA